MNKEGQSPGKESLRWIRSFWSPDAIVHSVFFITINWGENCSIQRAQSFTTDQFKKKKNETKVEFVLSEEAGPPLAFAGQSYSFPFWEPHLLQLSLAGTKPKMMQTESKHLIAVVGIKLAAGMELKKN